MTVFLSGPYYDTPTHGVALTLGPARHKVIEPYRHYLSTRPEQYPPLGLRSQPHFL